MTSQQLLKLKLPDAPGVYVFRDRQRRPLYIGRATSLKDRVKSYFSADLIEARGSRIVDMVTRAAKITWQETDSVLEAILLESRLIKSYQPFYNVDDRDDKSSNYVVITDEDRPRVFLARARDLDAALKDDRLPFEIWKKFGPYPETGLIKEALKILRKLFPFRDKKSYDPRHESFYRSIGRSPEGDDAAARRRYRNTIRYLSLFFEGKKAAIKVRLKKDMDRHARAMEFEDAGRVKRLLYALDHINDMALIKRQGRKNLDDGDRDFRIEAYDIAHLSGTNVVGAMTVFINGERAPSEYRRFKISREKNDDIAGLVETISRRLNHSEWAYPDLVVVDGNHNQLKAAEEVFRARRMDIPVVAVTKNDKHKATSIIGHAGSARSHEREIVAANAEAHRFALKYHRRRRSFISNP